MPDFRALGRRGGLRTTATHDMRRTARHARESAPSSDDYWRARVDAEDGELDASDRDRRARALKRLYFSDLARKRNRKQNGGGTTKAAGTAPAADALTDAHQLAPDGHGTG